MSIYDVNVHACLDMLVCVFVCLCFEPVCK